MTIREEIQERSDAEKEVDAAILCLSDQVMDQDARFAAMNAKSPHGKVSALRMIRDRSRSSYCRDLAKAGLVGVPELEEIAPRDGSLQ